MHLHITPALVRDLSEYETRPDETAIIITPTGWEIDVSADRRNTSLAAITLEDIHGYCDGGDLDDDSAEALAGRQDDTAEGGTMLADYRIPAEDGSFTQPRDGQDPRVVLPAIGDDRETAWEGAWWFDMDTARELIGIDHTYWRMNSAVRQHALLVTEGGRYLCRTHSNWSGEFGETWVEITPTEAAEWMYAADPDLVTDAEQPPLMVAARTAAELVAGMAAPEVPLRRHPDASDRAWEVEKEAAQVVRDAAVIATLVRERVAADLRKTRGEAARICVRAADGNTSEAARRLGIAQQTLAQLARD